MNYEEVSLYVPSDQKYLYVLYNSSDSQQNSIELSIFASIQTKKAKKNLKIRAIKDNTEIKVDLKRINDTLYYAKEEGIGTFYFRCINTKKLYTMLENKATAKLSVFIPINEQDFEDACKKHRFFFVG